LSPRKSDVLRKVVRMTLSDLHETCQKISLDLKMKFQNVSQVIWTSFVESPATEMDLLAAQSWRGYIKMKAKYGHFQTPISLIVTPVFSCNWSQKFTKCLLSKSSSMEVWENQYLMYFKTTLVPPFSHRWSSFVMGGAISC
jgi:hypothetical protein